MNETQADSSPPDSEQKSDFVKDASILGGGAVDNPVDPQPPHAEAAAENTSSAGDPTEIGGNGQAEDTASVIARAVCETVQDEMAHLLRLVEEKLTSDNFRESQIDRLHDELQEYRSDIVAKALRPIFSAIIRLHGDSGRLAQSLRGEPPDRLSPDRLIRMFEDFREDLERILRDNGVEPYTDQEQADHFNGRRQQAVGFVSTPDEGQHAVVAERVRPGFVYGETVLQKELVRVFKYEPAKPTLAPSNT
ncbi:molecular chaperone GrpE [Azospirillum oryzae]|uniref:Molecular chaperone GrpE n=1 Tax=Azospirillum oryzae TaxID=286727 RepID=A0A1X7FP29_9PROT|nr:hypothetical protein [Azospirillum oryzae]SMF55235.1 molecular chaperone GrpE [Azospirillum oryzae]